MKSNKGSCGTQSFIAAPIADTYDPSAEAVIAAGDCLDTLTALPSGFAKLIITSPPYNIGKEYEKATRLDRYLQAIGPIVDQLVRVLSRTGSLCWQVGNYVENSEVFPLDIFYYPFFKKQGLKLRNRMVWYFAHGPQLNKHLRIAA